jgi:hypothetical protein
MRKSRHQHSPVARHVYRAPGKILRAPGKILVEKLSNWQRKQWAKAGCPTDLDSLNRFIRLQRDGVELFIGEILPPRSRSGG